jgi:hypothetical protein
MRFVAPITFVGRTALSVETSTNLSTPVSVAHAIKLRIASRLL